MTSLEKTFSIELKKTNYGNVVPTVIDNENRCYGGAENMQDAEQAKKIIEFAYAAGLAGQDKDGFKIDKSRKDRPTIRGKQTEIAYAGTDSNCLSRFFGETQKRVDVLKETVIFAHRAGLMDRSTLGR